MHRRMIGSASYVLFVAIILFGPASSPVAIAQTVRFWLSGPDTLYVGNEAELRFFVSTGSIVNHLAEIHVPVEITFSNGNLIGPISEGNGFRFALPAIQRFEVLNFDSAHGAAASISDTILWSVASGDSSGMVGGWVLAYLNFTPVDTGTFTVNAVTLPSGIGLQTLDSLGQPWPVEWVPLTYHVVPNEFRITTTTTYTDRRLIVGLPGRIDVKGQSTGPRISRIDFPWLYSFSNGNIIGPLQEGVSVTPQAGAGLFDSAVWHPEFESATNPDTTLYRFMSSGGVDLTSAQVLWSFDFIPSDTGLIIIDSATLPPGYTLAAFDTTGQPIVIPWTPDTIRVLPDFRPVFDVSTNYGSDTMFVGGPGSIVFSIDPKGNELAAISWPIIWNFTNGNIIGPLSESTVEASFSSAAVDAFESISLNFGPFSGYETASLAGFIDFGGGGFTDSGEVWRLTFTPTDTGAIILDSTWFRIGPAVGYPNVVDPLAGVLPSVYEPDTIHVLPCQVTMGDVNEDGEITSADLVYFVNYIFKSGPDPLPMRTVGDVNCSGGLSGADIIHMVNFIFKSGSPPCACYIRII